MHRRRPARWLPFGLGALEVAQQVVEVVGGEIATAQVTSVAFDARPGRPILRFFFHGGWESRQPSGPAGTPTAVRRRHDSLVRDFCSGPPRTCPRRPPSRD